MTQALARDESGQQLALYEGVPDLAARLRRAPEPSSAGTRVRMCAGCRAREARYGFLAEDADPTDARPSTLCFDCFRVEIVRRQAIAARLARGWNATQVGLPLAQTLDRLNLRRRRAQIAARHALELR